MSPVMAAERGGTTKSTSGSSTSSSSSSSSSWWWWWLRRRRRRRGRGHRHHPLFAGLLVGLALVSAWIQLGLLSSAGAGTGTTSLAAASAEDRIISWMPFSSSLQHDNISSSSSSSKKQQQQQQQESSSSSSSSSSFRKNPNHDHHHHRYSSSSSSTLSSSSFFSHIHCIGDNFLPHTAWLYRSCQYRNICREYHDDTTAGLVGKWTLYFPEQQQQQEEQQKEEQEQEEATWLQRHKYARRSTFWKTNNKNQTTTTTFVVSPIAATPFHIRKQTYMWTPQTIIVRGGGGGGRGPSSSKPTPPLPLPPPLLPPDEDASTDDDIIGVFIYVPSYFLSTKNKQTTKTDNDHDHDLDNDHDDDKTMELLTQVLLPIYNLLGLFGWQQDYHHQEQEDQSSSSSQTKQIIRIYLLNDDDPLDESLGLFGKTDQDQQHETVRKDLLYEHDDPRLASSTSSSTASSTSTTSISWLQWGVEELMGWSLESIQERMIDHHHNNNHNHNRSSSSSRRRRRRPLCLKRAAAGMGLLSATGLSKRGYDAKDYTIHQNRAVHNAGRGATLWEFRNAILEKAVSSSSFLNNNEDAISIERMERVRAVLALGVIGAVPKEKIDDSSFSASSPWWTSILSQELHRAFPKNASSEWQVDSLEDLLKVESSSTPSSSPPSSSTTNHRRRRQLAMLQVAQQSNVWVAPADQDQWTWPAFFMPRGSTLVLLYNATKIPKRRPQDPPGIGQHPIYPDFGWWNQVSHLQVHWLALPNRSKMKSQNGDSTNTTPASTTKDLDSLVSLLKQIIQIQKRRGHAISDSVGKEHWTFNGAHPVDLVYRSPLPSNVHCIGENWEWDAPNYRSCQIENMCMNVETHQFVFQPNTTLDESSSQEEFSSKRLQVSSRPPTDTLSNLPTTTLTTAADGKDKENTFGVMMGQSIRRGHAEPWFPTDLATSNTTTTTTYYSLPSNMVWLPYFAEVPNANNPGHLLWDFFLPIYTLMELFYGPRQAQQPGQHDDYPRLLLTNLDTDCVSTNSKDACYKLTQKFLPLLGVTSPLVNAEGSYLGIKDHHLGHQVVEPETKLVCAANSLMGIGILTDHGVKKHGQLMEDYKTVRNVGRGMAFWRFRNFMLRNMGLPIHQDRKRKLPLTITFSINSSNNPSRKRDFSSQIKLLQSRYPTSLVNVQAVQLVNLSLQEQLQVMQDSSIFVTVIGGSASTAMFLERNSCLILYFNDIDDFVSNNDNPKSTKSTNMPAMLDWDFWNHASYLRVHWLPLSTMMDDPVDLRLFGRLIDDELAYFLAHQMLLE